MQERSIGFERLSVWQEARFFRLMIIDVCKYLPSEESNRLVDQIKRSSRSVTANITEGYGRFHYSDNIKFCRYARGSLNETLDHISVALDEKYIDQPTYESLKIQFETVLKLLNGYIGYLKKQKPN